MIQEVLPEGRANAVKGAELCRKLNINRRELMQAVEVERRGGAAICANTSGKDGGYYLAKDKQEMQEYCNSLYRRGGNLFKTRRACMATMDSLPEREDITADGEN